MRLVMNGINKKYLQDIVENHAKNTTAVLAAVAYATNAGLLFDWCSKNRIPLKYYGRLDEDVAVNINILKGFLKKKSPDYSCKLVQHHHAKVIWWQGAGMYVGSANLTVSAWSENIEAGCFFKEEEINDVMKREISDLFDTLETNSTPLTEELVKVMQTRADAQTRANALKKRAPDATDFWDSPSLKKWPGLIITPPKKPRDRKRAAFLDEWYATLQDLRDIGQQVSLPENRPPWINSTSPAGAQADQFLHAHYYQRTFEGKKANYEHFFEKNRSRKTESLSKAIEWWKTLSEAPDGEDEMLNKTAPFLQSKLSEKSLLEIDESAFRDICMCVHSTKDYARRVPNESVNLPNDGTQYSIPQKVDALANSIWHDQSSEGGRVKGLLAYILHDESDEQLPERLWQGVMDPKWKIDGLGISSLGEIVGWALPDRFPPRNGRTSKALRSLGYDVKVHV